MKSTSEILEQISFEMSKMLGKSKNKMTNEAFRAFVTEKWEEMGGDKYQNHSAYILISRMMNEAIRAEDGKDLVKWIREYQKHTKYKENPIEVKYNFLQRQFTDCKAFAEAVAFFKNEPNPEAARYVAFFQNIINNSEVMQSYMEEKDEKSAKIDRKIIKLEQWQAFFGEETAEIDYEILDEDGETTEKENANHKNGLEYLKNNQMQMLNAILSELLQQYPTIQERYKDFYSEKEKAEFMPDITDIKGFAELLSPTTMYIFSEYQDDIPYIGIIFHCMWEQEHGLGVIICQNRVVAIDDAEVAFDTYTVKKDVESLKKK